MEMEMEIKEEELRMQKLQEALEVKSLRRIISAYLNYPDAAKEDVKRCERSFGRLPPAHKALLSHLPSKYQRLRWCISKNTIFIFNMLQVFKPPPDMSQDIDGFEHRGYRLFSNEREVFSHQSAPTTGQASVLKSDEVSCGEGNNLTSRSPDSVDVNQIKNSASIGYDGGSSGSQLEEDVDKSGGNDVKNISNQAIMGSISDSCGNVLYIIRNIVRDWSAEGRRERDQCYKPILEELEIQFPNNRKESPPACLVPGAGLGRLALEISCLGFICQGIDFSCYKKICSSFILNHAETAEQWTIYPWIHSNSNSLSDSDQLRPVSFPDIHPASAGITEGFSMRSGDFVKVCSDPSQEGVWDAVVTCFFLGSAQNIVEYIEIISRILKIGGVWINLGPLLYHFADVYSQEDEMPIELSLEDVKRVAFHYGFKLEKERTVETTYCENPLSMMQNHYSAAFWTMRKTPMASPEQ